MGSKEPRVKGRTAEIVTPKIGMSEKTLKKAIIVLKEADGETKEKLRPWRPGKTIFLFFSFLNTPTK